MENLAYELYDEEKLYDEEILYEGYDVIMYTLQCIEEFDD